MNDEISESHINEIKEAGYRPCVMAALLYNGKLAIFKSKKYPGYYFLQGGIEPYETALEAVEREVIEELGYFFYSACQFPPNKAQFLFEDKMESKNIKDKITLSGGITVRARGKHYFIYLVDVTKGPTLPEINKDDYSFQGSSVEYSQVKWVLGDEAKKLLTTNTNPIKREMSLKTVEIISNIQPHNIQ